MIGFGTLNVGDVVQCSWNTVAALVRLYGRDLPPHRGRFIRLSIDGLRWCLGHLGRLRLLQSRGCNHN